MMRRIARPNGKETLVEQLIPFLIVCPLVFVAGFVDAIAGGGGLISLPAYLIAGLPVHSALGTNKLSSCMGTALATLRYASNGFIDARRAIVCVVFALVGSTCGANIALLIDDAVFKIVMLVVIPLTAAYVMFHKTLSDEKEPLGKGATIALCAAVSLALGVYDGFYGPGTGTFLMLAFTGAAHLKLQEATGTCKVVNLATNVAALTVFLVNGTCMLGLGLAAGVFNMAGAWLGVNCFIGKGVKITRPIMLIVLVIFFIKLIFDLVA